MSSSWKDRLLPSLQALLLSCSRATVLASEVRFEEDLTTSQDQALAVLIELDGEVKCLLRRILQPIACQPPPNPLLTTVLLGSTCALDLFERRIRLYGLSSQGRESVCESWTRLIETLQQYTLNLQSLIGAFDPVSPKPISKTPSLQNLFSKQTNDVQQELEAQIRSEAQQWDRLPPTQEYMGVQHEYPSSTYATPPSSIADDDIRDELPPIPGPPLRYSDFVSKDHDHHQVEVEQAREKERAKIYDTLKTIWIPEHKAPEERSSHLLRAIELNSVDGVNLLLDLGADVNQPCRNDLPLCLAARKGYDRIIETLLERGAKVEGRSAYGNTALLSAAKAGHTSTITILLAKNAKKEARSTSTCCPGYTPLMRAVKFGQIHAIRILVEGGANIATQSDTGESLLHIAIQGGQKEIIDQVLRLQPRIGIADRDGNTELHRASTKGLVEVCRYLVGQMKSLVRTTNHKQETPLHCAVNARRWKTPLHLAVEAKSQKIVQLLLDMNASPRVRDQNGKTPIHYAVDISNKSIVQLLAERMPSVDAKDGNKQTPLHYAVKSMNLEIVRVLLSHKAAANRKDRAGKAPLEYIMEMPKSDEETAIRLIQEFLRSHEKGQQLSSAYGFPALSKAAREGKVRLIQEFCQHDPNLANEVPASDSAFDPPLHEAIMSGHKESVQMLCIFPETDRNIFDRKGNTPLHQAIMHWQDGLLEMLIQDGADKDRPHAITGLPPLHFAASMQSLKKVQELLKAQADPKKRIEGPQCSWCKDHNSPPGRNARCVLQEVPDQDRTPEYCSINRLLSDAILRPNGAGSGSTNSSRRGKTRSPYRNTVLYV